MFIITGATRGIGEYLFEKYYNSAIGLYNNTKPKNNKLDKYYCVDISDVNKILSWKNNNTSILKDIVLINCAGINYNSLARKSDIEKWHNVIDVNLKGTFNMINALLPIMKEQEYGRIINLSSVVAQMPVAGTSAYAASKSALTGMVKSIAVENAIHGITVNNLNLGYFDIGMIAEVPENIQNMIKEKIPSKKFGNPSNIKNAIDFIVKSDYITGASIDINGGIL